MQTFHNQRKLIPTKIHESTVAIKGPEIVKQIKYGTKTGLIHIQSNKKRKKMKSLL